MINSKQAYSILDINNNEILTKDGSISLVYIIHNPEPYSLGEDKLDLRHSNIVKAFRNFESDVFIQQQVIVLEDTFDASYHYSTDSFLTNADREHFHGRETIKDYTFLIFTLSGLKSLEEKYVSNPLSYKRNLSIKDQEKINSFYEATKVALSIINKLYNTRIQQISEEEVKYFFKEYVNGFNEDNGLRDIKFDSNVHIGDNHYSAFSLSDSSYFPEQISNTVQDESIHIEELRLVRGYMDDFGVNFPKNHIYNQIVHLPGHKKLREELEKTIDLYAKNRSFGTGIEYNHKRLKEILKEILENGYTLCKSHFSIITWDKDLEKLKKKEDDVKGILGYKDIKYYLPSYEGLYHLFVGTIPGRASSLHKDFFFLNTLENAQCLFTNYSFYRDDEEGVVYQTRVLQTPIKRDLWDSKKKRISARNQIWYAPTGGGKSANGQHIVNQFFEEYKHIVVVEFGNSFEHLTLLNPHDSVQIKVDQNIPLGVNPFDLDGHSITKEKIYNLSHVVKKFWRLKVEDYEKEGVDVATRKFLSAYYDEITSDHSFIGFYHFVIENYNRLIQDNDIPAAYFDIQNFKLVCSEYLPGGIYENLCKGGKNNEDLLKGKRLVVFELSGIKDNPFLKSIVLSIISETFNEKVLSDRSTKGALVFDEMAKTQEMKDETQVVSNDVLQTVAHIAQMIRKENGALILIYQTPSQLPENRFANNILDNTQIIGVLQGNESVYNAIIKRHSIINQSHINLMKSVKNNFNSDRPYSEMCLIYNQDYAIVVRLELPRKKLLAFQTEGEKWDYLQKDFKETGSLEESINNLIKIEDEENSFNINHF